MNGTYAMRELIVQHAEWGVANAAQIHYSQNAQARVAALEQPRRLPQATDCSGFATNCYRAAGAPNPNTRDGSWPPGGGTFYTGTMLRCGSKVVKPLPGDLLLYGPWPGHHVVIYMFTWHGAWIVCSHGGEDGPIRIFQHREEVFQGWKPEIRSYLPRRP